ncbi:MAG: monovalent cation:proton antiporter-2 (CPA2) family protein [Bauldia sp.]
MPETIDAASHAAGGLDLTNLVVLLAAAVIAVPLFKRLGVGPIIGYLAAGVVIGPSALGFFDDPASVLHIAELGVVLLLFVIGLEMQPSRLWALRKDIFGLGVAQVVVCGAVLTGALILAGLDPVAAFIGGAGFTLTSTALVLQIMEDEGSLRSPGGQKIISILLLEDLAIVPLLAVVAFLDPGTDNGDVPIWVQLGTAALAILGVIFAGRRILTPLFRVLAATRAREIMTAAALLVVLGAAMALEAGGLSMAMGAFIAGVVLSESSFKHQLEADIEPFRGLLLGLFFLAVGMSLDLDVVWADWALVLGAVVGLMLLKALLVYGIARLLKSSHREGVHRALLMAQGGEFAFVLYAAAGDAELLDGHTLAILTAAVILSMAVTPLLPLLLRYLAPPPPESLDGLEAPEDLSSSALVIGFGRFGQVTCQFLLARGIDVTIIDSSPEMIRGAARFGFKIYFGDGQRGDVLHAAGAHQAKIICVCIDDHEAANRIVDVCREEFPYAKLFVRTFDRGHSMEVIGKGVEFEVRETVESALALGEASLVGLGFTAAEAAATKADIKARDIERLRLQVLEGTMTAGRNLVFRQPVPTPLTTPVRESTPLSEETAVVAAEPEQVPTPTAS